MWETRVRSLGRDDPLEKAMAPHSSTLAWKIPWTEEPGRLQSMGSQRVGHDRVTSLSLFTFSIKEAAEKDKGKQGRENKKQNKTKKTSWRKQRVLQGTEKCQQTKPRSILTDIRKDTVITNQIQDTMIKEQKNSMSF